MARPRVPTEVRRTFWQGGGAGANVDDASAAAGVSQASGWRWFGRRGGVIDPIVAEPTGGRLSFAEREEIACLRARGCGVREIARALERCPSTISRELARGPAAHRGYRASTAQADADALARRPKEAKLAVNDRLRVLVQERLADNHSPAQIACRLREDFPSAREMWVSHETIYQSLFVQGRGALRRDLTQHLRTGRALRRPRRQAGQRRARRERIPGMVNISERPAEAEDRAVPGHWEGDLILGSVASASAIGTLVERSTRFVMLLHLPDNHGALAVQEAM